MSRTTSIASVLSQLGLGIVLLAPVGAAHAMQLGRLELRSALGQQLVGKIPLVFGSHTHLKEVRVTLASQAEFVQAGLQWVPQLEQITFTPIERGGAYFIEVHSNGPIASPYLQFLLRVDWPGGRLLREYTALLNPPQLAQTDTGAPVLTIQTPATTAEPAPAPVAGALLGPPGIAAATVAPASGAGTSTTPASPAATEAATPPPAAGLAAATANKVGPLAPGASLWTVAQGLKPHQPAATLPQIMVALYHANRADFVAGNMNGLRRGSILRVPSAAQTAATTPAAAFHTLQVQDAAWNAYKARLAQAPLQAPSSPHTRHAMASGAVGGVPNASGRRLKIAGAGAAGVGAGGRSSLRRNATALQDALASSKLENTHLQGQVTQLEQQLIATKKLLSVENSELAALQAQSGHAAAPMAPAAATPAPAATPAAAASTSSAAMPETHPAAMPPVHKAVALPPVQKVSLLTSLLASSLFAPLAAGLMVLLLVIAFYYHRRRQSIAEFEESILSGGGISRDSTPSMDQAGKQTDVSFLSDFSQGGMGNIHTDEVDPIAEAEVYLAYGRDEQAEEILKEAIARDGSRQELKIRLLEVYAQRKDIPAFETLAEELYAASEGKGSKLWSKVEELGRKLNPSNPLFQQGQQAAGVSPIRAQAVGAEVAHGYSLDVDTATLEDALAGDEGGAPQDSGNARASGLFSAPHPELPDFAADAEATSVMTVESNALGGLDLDGGLEFNVEPPSGSNAAHSRSSSTVDAGLAPAGIEGIEWNFDMPAAANSHEVGGDVSIEEDAPMPEGAGTKLDLARAYMDMGDTDGARSILDEVMVEGDDTERQQAHRLVAQMG